MAESFTNDGRFLRCGYCVALLLASCTQPRFLADDVDAGGTFAVIDDAGADAAEGAVHTPADGEAEPPPEAGMLASDSDAEAAPPDATAARVDSAVPLADAAQTAMDSSTPDAAGEASDSYVPPSGFSATLPSWAEAMPGHYVYKGAAFSKVPLPWPITAALGRRHTAGFADVNVDASGVWLTAVLCHSKAGDEDGWLETTTAHPERLEPVRYRLLFSTSTQRWRAEPVYPAYFGATSEVPQACRGREGQLIARVEEQSWLPETDTCFCGLEGAITVANDCRVRDSDGDQKPGITTYLAGRWLLDLALPCGSELPAVEPNQGVLSGQVGQDGTLQVGLLRLQGRPLGLHESGECNEQLLGTATPCDAQYNRFEFSQRSEAAKSCADLLSSETWLLEAQAFPANGTCEPAE